MSFKELLNSVLDKFIRHRGVDKVSPYAHLSVDERLQRALVDQDFKEYCIKCKSENPCFDSALETAKKIAAIDINGIAIDGRKIYINTPISEEQVKGDVLEFYEYLDFLSPNGKSLASAVKENMQYFSTDNRGNPNARSYCLYRSDDQGNEHKEIFCNLEGRIGDTSCAIHEFGHSVCQSFTTGSKDLRMKEVTTVILDQISNYWLAQKYPQLADNFGEYLVDIQTRNVVKARESLLDGLIINMQTGEMSLQDFQSDYGDMYFKNTNVLKRCLDDIETYRFSNMYEGRYLVPQAIALKMLDRFKQDPKVATAQLKGIIAHDADWTLEETLDYLGMPKESELVDEYVDNFQKTISAIGKGDSNIAEKKNSKNEEYLEEF